MPLLGELFFSRLWGGYCSIAMGNQRQENQTKVSRTKKRFASAIKLFLYNQEIQSDYSWALTR